MSNYMYATAEINFMAVRSLKKSTKINSRKNKLLVVNLVMI